MMINEMKNSRSSDLLLYMPMFYDCKYFIFQMFSPQVKTNTTVKRAFLQFKKLHETSLLFLFISITHTKLQKS